MNAYMMSLTIFKDKIAKASTDQVVIDIILDKVYYTGKARQPPNSLVIGRINRYVANHQKNENTINLSTILTRSAAGELARFCHYHGHVLRRIFSPENVQKRDLTPELC